MRVRQEKRRFYTIRSKIIITIYLVMFPVLIAVGAFMYYRNFQAVISENTNRYQSTVTILNDSIGYFEQDMLDILTYIIVNQNVGRILRAPSTLADEDSFFWRNQSPMTFINDMIYVKNNIRTFILYPENGLTPFYVSLDGTVLAKDITAIRQLDIYQRAVEELGDTIWERVPSGNSGLFERSRNEKIVLAREIFDGSKRTKLGFMALSIDVAQYEQICNTALVNPYDGIIIMDGQNHEIARAGVVDDSVLPFLDGGSFSEDVPLHCGWFIFTEPRGNDGWIYYLSPKSSWDAKVYEGLLMPVVLAIALLVSVFPLSVLASRMISRPLGILYHSMNKFKEGDFLQQVEVIGNDEISELSRTFNHMVHDMKEMIDRNYVMMLREKESELDALQAQINPHFLYNALDSLYWQAIENDDEKLADNILSLSELFRLLLSSGKSEITVRQEIKLITSYLNIQKMRFGDKLDYCISVPDEMMEYVIPKLILQPFVENAIVHGLESIDTWGCIQVRGEIHDDSLLFILEDNGVGMPPEKVDEILFANEDARYANQRIGHYAIRNVKERMTLRYGDKAKLEIQSVPCEGTRISIDVPIVIH